MGSAYGDGNLASGMAGGPVATSIALGTFDGQGEGHLRARAPHRARAICCFRYWPTVATVEADLEQISARIVREVLNAGCYTPSTTRVQGRFAIRPCFINSRTNVAEANGLVEAVLAAGRAVTLCSAACGTLFESAEEAQFRRLT